MKAVLSKKRKELEEELKELILEEKRYESCLTFNFNEELIEKIILIINLFESEAYILGNFSLKEKDSYAIKYHQSEPDPSGCSSWGSRDEEAYTVKVEGEYINLYVILDKKTYDMFKLLTFSKCTDLKNNLFNILKDKKYVALNKNLNPNDFEAFPYIMEFLKLISLWRYENDTLDVPTETLNEIYRNFINENKCSALTKKIE